MRRTPISLLDCLRTTYYIVNAINGSFQLSLTQGGEAVAFGDGGSDELFIAFDNRNHLEHDPAVQYWDEYARLSIAEAQKYGKDVIPWLSPSFRGLGVDYIEKDFFRMQLETVFESGVEGVAIWNIASELATLPENRGWWEALTEFVDYLHAPTQFTVTVNPINDAPTTSGIPDVLLEGNIPIHSLDLHAYFSDVEDGSEGLVYSISHISEPDAVIATILDPVTGWLTITFSPTFSGSTHITVHATDSGGASIETTFAATLSGGGPPISILANDDFFSIDEDAPPDSIGTSVLANDVFAPDDVSVSLVDGPIHATTFQLNADGTFAYSPTTNYHGRDSFTYLLTNDDGDTSLATVTIDVLPQNDAPMTTGSPQIFVDEDAPLTTVDLWALFEDVDNLDEQLVFSVTAVSNPLLFELIVVDVDSGRLLVMLQENAHGPATLTVEARDPRGASATTTIDITILPINDAPVARIDEYFMEEDQVLHVAAVDGLLANDLDLDEDPLSVQLVVGPAHATQFELLPDGSFIYQPDPDFHGVDVFTYRTTDGVDVSAETQVTLSITNVNDAPVPHPVDLILEQGVERTEIALSQLFSDIDTSLSNLIFSVLSTDGDPVITAISADSKTGLLVIHLDADQTGRASVILRGAGWKSVC